MPSMAVFRPVLARCAHPRKSRRLAFRLWRDRGGEGPSRYRGRYGSASPRAGLLGLRAHGSAALHGRGSYHQRPASPRSVRDLPGSQGRSTGGGDLANLATAGRESHPVHARRAGDRGAIGCVTYELSGFEGRNTQPSDPTSRAWAGLRDGSRGPAGRLWLANRLTFGSGCLTERRSHGLWTCSYPVRVRERCRLRPWEPRPERPARSQVTVKLDELSVGWHRVPLDKLPQGQKLTFSLSAGKETPAGISEMQIEGSRVPFDEAPRLTVTYPLSGECVNHRVHVRGFVTPAGADALMVNGAALTGALSSDGAFAFEMSEKQTGGRAPHHRGNLRAVARASDRSLLVAA